MLKQMGLAEIILIVYHLKIRYLFEGFMFLQYQ